jgi:hypothetical protein
MQTKLPLVGKFRFPSRYFLLSQLGFAVLAAVGMAELAKLREGAVVTSWATSVAARCDGGTGSHADRVGVRQPHGDGRQESIARGGGRRRGDPGGRARSVRRARPALALWALLPLAVVDLWGYGVRYHQVGHDRRASWPRARHLPAMAATGERVAAGRDNVLGLSHWRILDGVAGLDPLRELDYRDPAAMRVAGVRWVVPDAIDASERVYSLYESDELVKHLPQVAPNLYEMPPPLPRVRLVAQARVSQAPARDLDAIDPAQVALVDAPVELGGSPGTASLVRDRPVASSCTPMRRPAVAGRRGELCQRLDGAGRPYCGAAAARLWRFHRRGRPDGTHDVALEYCSAESSRPGLSLSFRGPGDPGLVGLDRSVAEIARSTRGEALMSTVRPALSICMPIFNEEKIIPLLLPRLQKVVRELGVPAEVIICNDGSRDGTLALLLDACATFPELRVVSLSRNFGHPQACVAALEHATGSAGSRSWTPTCRILPSSSSRCTPSFARTALASCSRSGGRAPRAGGGRSSSGPITACSPPRPSQGPGRRRQLLRHGSRGRRCLAQPEERAKYLPGLRAWVGFAQEPVYFDRPDRPDGEPKVTFSKLVKLAIDGLVSFSTWPLRVASVPGSCSLRAPSSWAWCWPSCASPGMGSASLAGLPSCCWACSWAASS